jgi:hypothetical protein
MEQTEAPSTSQRPSSAVAGRPAHALNPPDKKSDNRLLR